ncbi:hypothetical protein PLEOSDRAFT_1099252 [Pleurotus ostreatus PC15]|uniref:Retinoic acid induced 16-like protein-domain-containing protein n=1 Tax=Pleurotus ostreatus (strain PC15) TaxID=1137138 RepID=A0A067P214_PLEO1|nr:hypothetical protein PLEOSDRAFT_1099252 [Pleurotus ostreatus PC15]
MSYFTKDYFASFLNKPNQPQSPKVENDKSHEFILSWNVVKSTLMHPDERQLAYGIDSTDVPTSLKAMVDALVWETTRTEAGATGACMEYLLKNDVLGTLVRLSESDRPSGVQAYVLKTVQNMVIMLDEQFLVHSAVHRAVLRLLRNCVGDDIQEQLDGRNKLMGAAKNSVRSQPSEYEEDLVHLLCLLCSRILTYRELLMIFFHDKHWYRSEPLFSVNEEDEDEDDEDDDEGGNEHVDGDGEVGDESTAHSTDTLAPPVSPTSSQSTVTSAPASSVTKRTEYEFLLFNYLLRFVHREGNIGEYARIGLLYLMDVAMSPCEPTHRLGDTQSSLPAAGSDPIMDAALALAEYILDGDFSEVLAAGLGAVYSLLPTKLEFRPMAESEASPPGGMVIGGTGPAVEDEKERREVAKDQRRAMGIEDASSPDFKLQLEHFLKLLQFLQDVLKRNVTQGRLDSSLEPSALIGAAIAQSILDAVRQVFLENILYPSVLECSDADGSAVAVMSYIEVMICTLRDGQLSDLLVNFLMSEDNDEIRSNPRPASLLSLNSAPPQTRSSGPPASRQTKLKRRKSSAMALLEMEAPDSNRPSEYFTSMGRFTLKDLLLTNLRSQSQATATSALQLLRTMLLCHPQLCQDRLLIVIPDPLATCFPYPSVIPAQPLPNDAEEDEIFKYPGADDTELENPSGLLKAFPFPQPDTTYNTHEREMDLYLTLVSRVDPSHSTEAFSTGYEHYLHDALMSIQSHPAFQMDIDNEARKRMKHRMNVNDPLTSLVLDSLRNFFANTPEFNMTLTGALVSLAIHPDRSLAGWLTFATPEEDATDGLKAESVEDDLSLGDDDRSIDFKIQEDLATESNILPALRMDDKSRPVVHTIFHSLVSQLERYRQLVNNFDKLLLERRQGLLFSENLNDALSLGLNLDDASTISSPPPTTPEKPKVKVKSAASSIVSFLTPRKSKAGKTAPPSEPTSDSRSDRNLAASPFGAHYQETTAITVEPFAAPSPIAAPWAGSDTAKWSTDDEDVFSSGWSQSKPSAQEEHPKNNESPPKATITLSQLLDSVVILEESIKELAAIIHARRSLGIDAVRYI